MFAGEDWIHAASPGPRGELELLSLSAKKWREADQSALVRVSVELRMRAREAQAARMDALGPGEARKCWRGCKAADPKFEQLAEFRVREAQEAEGGKNHFRDIQPSVELLVPLSVRLEHGLFGRASNVERAKILSGEEFEIAGEVGMKKNVSLRIYFTSADSKPTVVVNPPAARALLPPKCLGGLGIPETIKRVEAEIKKRNRTVCSNRCIGSFMNQVFGQKSVCLSPNLILQPSRK